MTEYCSVCGVGIDGDVVKFSSGTDGTKDRLYARVCQYARDKSNCLLKEYKANFGHGDGWKMPGNLTFDGSPDTAIAGWSSPPFTCSDDK